MNADEERLRALLAWVELMIFVALVLTVIDYKIKKDLLEVIRRGAEAWPDDRLPGPLGSELVGDAPGGPAARAPHASGPDSADAQPEAGAGLREGRDG